MGRHVSERGKRVFPTGVTIALLLCGLLGAGPILIEMAPTALKPTGFARKFVYPPSAAHHKGTKDTKLLWTLCPLCLCGANTPC